jgi:hypothetical protein
MEKDAPINWPLFVYCISLITSFNIRDGCVVKFRMSFKDHQSTTHNGHRNLSLRIISFSVKERHCLCIREVPVWNLGRSRIVVSDIVSLLCSLHECSKDTFKYVKIDIFFYSLE